MRWQPLRLVDRLGSNLTDGWPGAEQQTRVPVKNGCGRKQCRRETSGVCQATILRTAIATWFARAFSQRPCRSPLGRQDRLPPARAPRKSAESEAEDIFYEFSSRRVDGTSNPDEDERVWGSRGEGKAGYGHLMGLLEKQGTPDAEAAVLAIQQARAKTCIPALTDKEVEAAGGDVVDALARKVAAGRESVWARWRAALDRLRRAVKRPVFVTGGWTEDADDGAFEFDPTYAGPVPSRPQISDRLTRGLVSMISAAPNVGKSTYLGLEALAIATENGALIGQQKVDWCGDILIVSNEESRDSIVSRWRGQMRTSGLKAGDIIKHKLRVWPGKTRLRIGRLENGAVVPTDDGVKFVEALAARAEKGSPTAFIGMDTLVSLFEGLDENSASQMDKALGLIAEIAEAGFAAIDVMHHTGKASPSETTTSYRGSSAISAVAEMSTLVLLPAEDAERFRLPPDRAQRTLRLAGQRQRDGAIPGAWYFEREVVSLAAQDPRDPQALVFKTIATLKAIPAPVAPGVNLEDHAGQWSRLRSTAAGWKLKPPSQD
jgi:hypothetical protein